MNAHLLDRTAYFIGCYNHGRGRIHGIFFVQWCLTGLQVVDHELRNFHSEVIFICVEVTIAPRSLKHAEIIVYIAIVTAEQGARTVGTFWYCNARGKQEFTKILLNLLFVYIRQNRNWNDIGGSNCAENTFSSCNLMEAYHLVASNVQTKSTFPAGIYFKKVPLSIQVVQTGTNEMLKAFSANKIKVTKSRGKYILMKTEIIPITRSVDNTRKW